jgi:hypothetical protein
MHMTTVAIIAGILLSIESLVVSITMAVFELIVSNLIVLIFCNQSIYIVIATIYNLQSRNLTIITCLKGHD